MAKKLSSLIDSYYEWLMKTESKLRSNKPEFAESMKRMPTMHPTGLSEVREHTDKVRIALHGTQFAERSVYWNKLFTSIVLEGWKGD
jgi:hypothetical protein